MRADDKAGAALLFAKNPGKLSAAERVEIYKALGLKVSDGGKTLVDESCAQEMSSEVDDQRPQRRRRRRGADHLRQQLHVGHGRLVGGPLHQGQVRPLQSQLGFPGMIAEVRKPKSGKGYPDLADRRPRLLLSRLALERQGLRPPARRAAEQGRLRPPEVAGRRCARIVLSACGRARVRRPGDLHRRRGRSRPSSCATHDAAGADLRLQGVGGRRRRHALGAGRPRRARLGRAAAQRSRTSSWCAPASPRRASR